MNGVGMKEVDLSYRNARSEKLEDFGNTAEEKVGALWDAYCQLLIENEDLRGDVKVLSRKAFQNVTNTSSSSLKKAEARSALERTESESLPEATSDSKCESTTSLTVAGLGALSINLDSSKGAT